MKLADMPSCLGGVDKGTNFKIEYSQEYVEYKWG